MKGNRKADMPNAQKPIKSSFISRLPMKTRRSISGYLFIMPFIIGFLFFMVSPLVMSLQMSFSRVNSDTIQPNNFYMDSYLGYGPEVELSKEIVLPETLRYDPARYENREYVVEPVDEVLTLKSDFAYGHTVSLDRKIDLPSYVWYNPYDLQEGKYNVEPLKSFLDLGTAFTFSNNVVLSEKIPLPREYQYNKMLEKDGVNAVELSASILSLDAKFTFGKRIAVSKAIDLPEGYHYLPEEELSAADKEAGTQYIVADNGENIPVSFAVYLFENGLTTQLKAAVEAVKPDTTVRFTKTAVYDKALYEAEGQFVVKAVVPVDFAVYMLDNGYLPQFAEAVAAVKGMASADELNLPEYFTYDRELFKSKNNLTIQVADDEAAVPTKFAAYLIDNGHSDLFYATADVVANSTAVCALYKPEYDAQQQLTGFGAELPAAITYDADLFAKQGIIDVKLNAPQVPFSFAGTLLSNGLFFETILDLLGLDNYVHMLTVDPKFNQLLIDEITKMVIHTIAILVVSFVIAILLNQEFKGRAFVRAIFFLPVILSSGVLVNLEADNSLMQGLQDLISEQTPFTVTDSMMEILRLTGLGGDLLDIIFDLIAEVYDIVMASGIQIVVFLSGLQNVPASLYEAADVEGCTKWESFWKITFPLVSPLLIVNIIYTIIDFFTKMGGDLSRMMDDALLRMEYDYMSAMSWLYFLVTLALIGVSALIVSKVVASDE